jgi:F-type H+-transporting ATPase subunit gamma
LEQWRLKEDIGRIVLFFNKPTTGSAFQSNMLFLLPLNLDMLKELKRKKWKSHALPNFRMKYETLFFSLIREYFFVSIYRAVAESLASENASRLSAMQAAEKNIEERLDDLNDKYNRQRQNSITSELMDIVSGFEALTKE